jgi:hypothetical protein
MGKILRIFNNIVSTTEIIKCQICWEGGVSETINIQYIYIYGVEYNDEYFIKWNNYII